VTKFSRSWSLMRASWQLLREDKKLLCFPFLSGVCCLIVLGAAAVPALLGGGEASAEADASGAEQVIIYGVIFLLYFTCYLIITFFNSAVVASAARRMQGESTTLADGFRAAFYCLHLIAGWALVMATVGLLLSVLEDRLGRVGKLFVWLLGLSWAAVSFLVVPVLVIEQRSPVAALRGSAQLLKRAWGQGVLCNFNFGLVLLIFSLPAILLLVVGAGIGSSTALMVCVGSAIVYLLLLAIVHATLKGVFQAALYFYARSGLAPEGFRAATLREAMSAK